MSRRTRIAAASSLAALALALPASSASAACPNEAIRESQTSEALPLGTAGFPHCMALEMVSPAKKSLQPAFKAGFGEAGGRVRFESIAALADTEGQQYVFGDQYVATRGSGGWVTSATSPPTEAEIAAGSLFGGPVAFSADFSRWISIGGTSAQARAGQTQVFGFGLDAPFVPLSPLLTPIDDSGSDGIFINTTATSSVGASADLAVVIFRSSSSAVSYLLGDPRSKLDIEPGDDSNLYLAFLNEAGEPTIELLARDKEGTVYGGRCGTRLGGGTGGTRGTGRLTQGAISPDGKQIYFSTRPSQPAEPTCSLTNPLRIMVRTSTPTGPTIEELAPGGPATGDDLYQGASVDGGLTYFTTTRALVPSDKDSGTQCSATPGASAGCDLYLYDASLPDGERLIQVSAGEAGSPTPGEGAEVLSSITAISSDGSRAYLPAEGILTTDPNPVGDTAQAGEPNLYVFERGSGISFVGSLADGDKTGDGESGLWGGEQAFANDAAPVPFHDPPVGGDGQVLIFASKAPLTADDADGGFRDLFRYDAEAETLERISAAAQGGSEVPASDVSVNSLDFLKSRWVSEDGEAIAFATAEPLVPGDEDEASNPYLWRDGELLVLPGQVEDAQENPSVSADGDSVAFATPQVLLPAFDGDTAKDVYLARVNGGFPNPAPPQLCDPLQEGACQESAPSVPVIPWAASATFSGPGNPKGASCRKPKVKRKGRCVKPRRRAAKGRNAKRAKNDRGGRR